MGGLVIINSLVSDNGKPLRDGEIMHGQERARVVERSWTWGYELANDGYGRLVVEEHDPTSHYSVSEGAKELACDDSDLLSDSLVICFPNILI